VGFVFQNSDVQLFSPTVFEEVAFGPLQLNMKPEFSRDSLKDAGSINVEAFNTSGAQGAANTPTFGAGWPHGSLIFSNLRLPMIATDRRIFAFTTILLMHL
jgi:hypothetical protein